MLHNRYLQPGGEDISFQVETDMLRQNGDEVVVYEESNERIAELGNLRTGLRAVWSTQAYRELCKMLNDTQFDVMHVQNFFPLISPAAYYAASRYDVPVVQSLRNYRLHCLPGTFYRDGTICDKCRQMHLPWPGVWHRCYRNSALGSTSVAAMLWLHKLIGTWQHKVDIYVALSDFARDQYVLGGLPEHKIVRKYNFVDPVPQPGTGAGGYALFVGRFEHVKGIGALLDAWKSIAGRIPLKLVGDGPLADDVEAACRNMPGLERLGWQSPERVFELIGDAKFVIVPSAYYEPFGRVVSEAFAKGTPVVGSRAGALTELIDDGRTGLLFEPNNVTDMAEKIRRMADDQDLAGQMREEARRKFNAEFTAKVNYAQIKQIYERAIAARHGQEASLPA